jgi:hypothetical protein
LKIFLAIIVGVFVILLLGWQLVLPGVYFPARIVTSTTAVIPPSAAVEAVNESFTQHIHLFESGSVSALASQYTEDANVTWTGRAYCFSGTYIGRTQITETLNSFLNRTVPGLSIMNLTRTITPQSNGLVVTVDSTFGFSTSKTTTIGLSTYPGLNGTVSARETYAHVSTTSSWLISNETWYLLTLNSSVPLCGLPG